MFPRFTTLLTVAALTASGVQGYTLTGSHWYSSTITMQLQLGANPSPLSDGAASWGAAAEDALSIWNSNIGLTRFTVVRDSTAALAEGNRLNNVFFSNDVYGQAWGTGVLAVTLTYTSGGTQSTECDVLFNQTLHWDSYRGSLRYGTSGTVYDFHRVALHEFGHVLGLDHPDQAGQSVVAIMNSRISSLDTLASDDITGVQSIYGANPSAVTAPTITTQPASQSVAPGATVTFSVAVSGTAPFTYSWRKNGVAITGATQSSYTLSSVQAGDAGSYAVAVSNSAGSVTSNSATLTVSAAPVFTTQPASQSVNAGSSLSLSASATGTPAPTLQWFKNGTAISGASSGTYTIASVTAADAGTYTARAVNTAGTTASANAIVTVNTAPAISTAPVGSTVSVGDAIRLSVAASGSPAPTYQWQKNGVNIAGATQSTFTIATAAPTDSGTYDVVLTNAAGTTATVPVLVTVKYSQLINLSTRGFIPAGGALTTGFVLRGSVDKAVVVRGVGPTLNGFGVTNPLTNPQLAVIAQSTAQTLAFNDGWSVTPQLSTEFQNVGAFPLPAGSADSASELRLMPGDYTTRVVSNTAATSGVALAEVYDAEPSSARTRLVNLSTLGFAGSGDNALVAGFTIQGNAPKRVLLRAIGPGLAPYNVSGALVNPRLDVYPLGKSVPIAGNDDWAGTAELKAAFASSGAFSLVDTSRDAALILSLDPGAYTVVLTGADGGTGYALVEIYDLDP